MLAMEDVEAHMATAETFDVLTDRHPAEDVEATHPLATSGQRRDSKQQQDQDPGQAYTYPSGATASAPTTMTTSPEGPTIPPPFPSSPGQQLQPQYHQQRRRRTLRLSQKQREAVKRKVSVASKQFIMFLVSHVGLTCLVVGYSIMGAFLFQFLEASHEVASIGHIKYIREYHVKSLWNVTQELNVFEPEHWGRVADKVLMEFQMEIYKAVHDKGWDGTDNVTSGDLQWTIAGSLLYSVTVITTIGYGHLTPKTTWGRAATMAYAIVGIPMTLLCLTNIGSFMARCFRLLWKQIVCKPCRNRIRRRSMYLAARKASAANHLATNQAPSAEASKGEEAGSKGGETGYGPCDVMARDSPAAVHDSSTFLLGKAGANGAPLLTGEPGRYLMSYEGPTTARSLSSEMHNHPALAPAAWPQQAGGAGPGMVEAGQYPAEAGQYPAEAGQYPVEAGQYPVEAGQYRMETGQYPEAAPGQEGFGDVSAPPAKKVKTEVVRVPIMVCLVIVVAYIILGASLFAVWEGWGYFDSSYFCFITLSTIGFGDFVPGYDHKMWGNQAKRVSCTLYLLFGLALLAMCFELIQSECRQKFKDLARALGFAVDDD